MEQGHIRFRLVAQAITLFGATEDTVIVKKSRRNATVTVE
jgi:hypothetical protein